MPFLTDSETISAWVFASALHHADRVALSCRGEHISYATLNRKALQVAAELRNQHRVNGAHIGILTQRTLSAYYGILGTLYAGHVYVPLNPKHPLPRLAAIINNANISTVIFDACEDMNVAELERVVGRPLSVILPVLEGSDAAVLAQPVAVDPQHLAYIMFTSGSTGEPKGVMVSHQNVSSHIRNMTALYAFTTADKLSQTFDLSFDPSVSDIFCAWGNGATLCVMPAEEVYCVSDFINREHLTFWASVPTLANFMVKMDQLQPNIFPTLKWSTFCGEPLPQCLANQWSLAAPHSTVENLYGPTEATVYITRYNYQRHEQTVAYKNRIVPIGVPLPGQHALVVDDQGCEVSLGTVGELWVAGSQITQGYFNDTEKTARVFIRRPEHANTTWYKTGDLAVVNANGDLECLGRIDSQIKIGGQRMEIGEIEAVLRDLSGTSDVAVIPLAYVDGLPQGVVAFVAKNLTTPEITDLQLRCKQAILAPFVPKSIVSIAALPLNPSGKIDRKALHNLWEISPLC